MKRYSLEELDSLLEQLVYDYLANDNKLYFQDKIEKEGKNVPTLIFEERDQLAKDIRFRINDYKQRKEEDPNTDHKCTYDKAIGILKEELKRVENISIETQKKLYEETKDIFISTTFVTVPLNKKINALYDDFNIFCCFRDNLANEQGSKEFSNLKTEEERLNYVKNHIEITHILMILSSSSQTGIIIRGNSKAQYTDPSSSSTDILPSKYADFENITLKDCEEIANNDLKQIIQERIDMDKENLIVLAEENIKGDLYKILKSKNKKDLYIRYICPSTGRVYYNLLNINYLQTSEYFINKNYSSYIKAWYSINNLYMPLDEESLALTMTRC